MAYSLRKLFTGFATAALMVWKLTVISAISNTNTVANKNTQASIVIAIKADAKCILYVYPGVGHLLTRNLKIQYKDFDADPANQADAHQREDDFLYALGYIEK